MLANNKIMAFLATSNVDAARDFYQHTLGLRLIEEHDFAIVFDAFGTELRLQKTNGFTPQPHTILGWSVPNIIATVRELTTNGVEFIIYDGMGQDEHGIWHTPSGAKIAWFKEPDQNLLSLTQKS